MWVLVSVAIFIQHAMRMRRVILRLCPVRLYSIFAHYHVNSTIKKTLNIKCEF
jgi:hypothetical protein